MFKTQSLEKNLAFLLDSAKERETEQGIKLYEHYLSLLERIQSKEEFNELLEKICNTLGGIEAHGYFTDEEYECVTEIRAMKRF